MTAEHTQLTAGARSVAPFNTITHRSASALHSTVRIGCAGSYQRLGGRVVHHTPVGGSTEWYGVELPRST